MSFAGEVRKELVKHYTKKTCCRQKEWEALVLLNGVFSYSEDKPEPVRLTVTTTDEELAKKLTSSYRKSIAKDLEYKEKKTEGSGKKKKFEIFTEDHDIIKDLSGKISLDKHIYTGNIDKPCCRRAFLRGAFLAAGTVSDPEKNYHFEIACGSEENAIFIKEMINSFGLSARTALRRGKYIVYLKEGIEISDILNIIEAHVALMNFENARIVREMRGNVNRKVNCETANIGKTVGAAMKQIEDIKYIMENSDLEGLDESLINTARIRLENPDVPLSRLGDLMDPPVGKSGVNHRLRKLSRLADELRNK